MPSRESRWTLACSNRRKLTAFPWLVAGAGAGAGGAAVAGAPYLSTWTVQLLGSYICSRLTTQMIRKGSEDLGR